MNNVKFLTKIKSMYSVTDEQVDEAAQNTINELNQHEETEEVES